MEVHNIFAIWFIWIRQCFVLSLQHTNSARTHSLITKINGNQEQNGKKKKKNKKKRKHHRINAHTRIFSSNTIFRIILHVERLVLDMLALVFHLSSMNCLVCDFVASLAAGDDSSPDRHPKHFNYFVIFDSLNQLATTRWLLCHIIHRYGRMRSAATAASCDANRNGILLFFSVHIERIHRTQHLNIQVMLLSNTADIVIWCSFVDFINFS